MSEKIAKLLRLTSKRTGQDVRLLKKLYNSLTKLAKKKYPLRKVKA